MGLITILLILNVLLFEFDFIIKPTIVSTSNAKVREKTTEIINRALLDECNKDFNYDDFIKVEKDSDGNITLIKADSFKMNKYAAEFAITVQRKLKEIGEVKIKIPVGYIYKNNVIANMGPPITIRAQPIGSIETEYFSEFQNQGINQTRHKIYIKVKTNMKVILPMSLSDVEVQSKLPIAETIIVGKIPSTALQMDFSNAGFKFPVKESEK